VVLDTSVRSEVLRPFVPRLVIDWLRETPTANHRAVEGTLAFVDISGFTAMTERLARKGKVGAEEVNDVLDRCFSELLAVAYADGAGLVKWGGDAVLLLFQGDEQAARACRAAVGMRAALRRMGRLQTSAGHVTLRMSVGVHSGEFHFFLVGRRHRELVLTGPAASRTVEMESLASAGEIAVSREAADQLDPVVLGREMEGGILLRRAPSAERVLNRESPDVADLDLQACLSQAIGERLLTGSVEPEHRHVTAAFVQFGGTDELLERSGPAEVANALDTCIRSVQEAAYRNDVTFFETDIAHDGGKIMLIAGAPRSTGEEEERMLATARAIMDGAGALPLRIGVNAGHVFAGEFGPPYRRTYSVKGDCVNLAARLMAKAERGQILASRGVVGAARTPLELVALEPFLVKGKAKPVEAFAVGRPTGAASGRRPGGRLPLIGRARELAILREGMRSARELGGVTVELVGDPGIGKSRLIEKLVHEASGDMVVVSAACELYESSTPYWPFRALLRDLLGIRDGTEPERAIERLRDRVWANAPHLLPWLPLLGIPLDLAIPGTPETDRLEDQFRRQRLEQVASNFLGWSLPTPTLLVLEDVHWMDEASAELLRRLAADVQDRPWMICATRRARSATLLPEGVRSISLVVEPLPEREAAALVSAATEEAPIPSHERAALAERSGGNPLFLQELVVARRGAASVDVLPDSVEALVAAEIDRLAPPDRTLLRYASVLGPSFGAALVDTALAGLVPSTGDDAWRRLTDFVDRDQSGAFHFRHALIRDAAYEGLSFRRRKDIHARVGETLEAGGGPDEQAELLSFHFFQAQRFDKAWRYSRLAGQRAEAKYANVAAADFYRRAAEAGRRLRVDEPALASVWVALGDVCERAGLYVQARDAYRNARRINRRQGSGLSLKEGVIRERMGQYSQALRWYSRALHGQRDEALTERIELSLAYAGVRFRQGRYRECVRWCERIVPEAETVGDRASLAHAYYLLHLALTAMGDARRLGYRGLALPIYEEIGDLTGQAKVLNNLGFDAYYEGNWNEALDLYRRSREAQERAGNLVFVAIADNNISEILSDQGRLGEAEELLRQALATYRAARYRMGEAFATSNLGRAAARGGRLEEAFRLLEQAQTLFAEIGDENLELETEARMAEALVLAGEANQATAKAQEVLSRLGRSGPPVLQAMLLRQLGYAAAQRGRLDEARSVLEESLAVSGAAGARYEVALTLQAKGRVLRMTGEPGWEAAELEADSILEGLGVVRTPEVPLPVPARA
jgi:class 3 adenylate cyclase/tetratricopeptide (TPR) repeat protein